MQATGLKDSLLGMSGKHFGEMNLSHLMRNKAMQKHVAKMQLVNIIDLDFIYCLFINGRSGKSLL